MCGETSVIKHTSAYIYDENNPAMQKIAQREGVRGREKKTNSQLHEHQSDKLLSSSMLV